MQRQRARHKPMLRLNEDLFWLGAKVLLGLILLALCWNLIGTLLGMTLGQVLLLVLAFGLGWWIRGVKG